MWPRTKLSTCLFSATFSKNSAIIAKYGSRLKDFLPSSCINLTEKLFEIMVGVFILHKVMNVLIYSTKIY